MFDSDLTYSAMIVVFIDNQGDVKELTRIPFHIDHWYESDEYEALIQRVENAAREIARVYDYWPDGLISVQTRINRSYCNV